MRLEIAFTTGRWMTNERKRRQQAWNLSWPDAATSCESIWMPFFTTYASCAASAHRIQVWFIQSLSHSLGWAGNRATPEIQPMKMLTRIRVWFNQSCSHSLGWSVRRSTPEIHPMEANTHAVWMVCYVTHWVIVRVISLNTTRHYTIITHLVARAT